MPSQRTAAAHSTARSSPANLSATAKDVYIAASNIVAIPEHARKNAFVNNAVWVDDLILYLESDQHHVDTACEELCRYGLMYPLNKLGYYPVPWEEWRARQRNAGEVPISLEATREPPWVWSSRRQGWTRHVDGVASAEAPAWAGPPPDVRADWCT